MFRYLTSWLSRSAEFFESTGPRKAAELAREVSGGRTLIVLATIGFLACAFYVYVLFHWMRDTNARRELVPRLKIKPIGSLSKNARISLAPEGLQEVVVALRPGYCGLPAWQCGSTVAALVAMGASGRCGKRSRDPGAWARESNWIILYPGICDANHIVRAVSS